MSSNLSGVWYNPEHDGSGFLIFDWGDGILLYWFSYAVNFPTLKGEEQLWFLCQPVSSGSRKNFNIYKPKGEWMGKTYEVGLPVGQLVLTEKEDQLEVHYNFNNFGPCKPVMVSPVWWGCGGTIALTRLTPKSLGM